MKDLGSEYTRKAILLPSLSKAAHVMACLRSGLKEAEIANSLQIDDEAVQNLIDYLVDKHLVFKGKENNTFFLTDLGKIDLAEKKVLGNA